MRKKNIIIKIITCLFLVSFISLSLFYDMDAIPAFARKYKTSCATCHIAVSKRNAFGEAFRRNGYVMTKQNARLVKEPPLKLGADAWKEVWPDAIWPSDMPGSFPIAAYANMRAEYDFDNSAMGKHFEFNMPFDLSLVFGGSFSEDFGFFGAWSYNFGLNRIFLTINDILGPKDFMNIKLGEFPAGMMDGYPDNQKLTMERTSVMGYSVSGEWSPYVPQAGIELNGILAHFIQYNIGVVNGDNKVRFDVNNEKDGYARIAYKFGGFGLDGYGFALDSGLTDLIDDNSFTLGLYTYYGNLLKTTKTQTTYNNAFHRFGFDMRIRLGELDLLGGLITGLDEHPSDSLADVKSTSAFIEANYSFYPWLIGIIRGEQSYAVYDGNDLEKCYKIIPNVCLLIRQNVRLSVEGLIVIYPDKTTNTGILKGNNDNPVRWFKMNLMFAY